MSAPSVPSADRTAPARPLPARRLLVADIGLMRGEKILASALSFAVGPGELLLLRGPNGAGKSTLLSALALLTRPFCGTITIETSQVDPEPRTDIHFLGHLSAVKPRLSVLENLAFWAALNGPTGLTPQEALVETGLDGLSDLDAGVLSAGQTRRLALARFLVSDRPIWLLDEPTASLDGRGEALVGRLLQAHLERGGLAVVATHHDLAVSSPARTLTLGTVP